MSQTSLTVEEIVASLGGKNGADMPLSARCQLIDKLGEIACKFGQDTAKAQGALVTMLASRAEKERWIAYKCLQVVETSGLATRDTDTYMADFRGNHENDEITS